MFEKLNKEHGKSNSHNAGEGINEFIAKHNSRDPSTKPTASTQKTEKDKAFDDQINIRIQKLEAKGRKRGKRYSLIGILGGLLIAGIIIYVIHIFSGEVNKMSDEADKELESIPDIVEQINNRPKMKKEWLDCQLDMDCLETQKNCCGCQNGGKQIAVNKQYFAQWQDRINSKCSDQDCPAEDNCQPGIVECVDSVCVFSLIDPEDLASSTAGNPEPIMPENGSEEEKILKISSDWEVYTNYRLGVSFKYPAVIGNDPVTVSADKNYIYVHDISDALNLASSSYYIVYFDEPGAINEEEAIGSGSVYNVFSGQGCERIAYGNRVDDIDAKISQAWLDSIQELEIEQNQLDYDDDGLDNATENIIGTDIFSIDSDGDGYDDASEYNNGYNPLGEGKL